MSSAYDREMRKALQADAEKLEQLTGEPQPFHVDEGFFDIGRESLPPSPQSASPRPWAYGPRDVSSDGEPAVAPPEPPTCNCFDPACGYPHGMNRNDWEPTRFSRPSTEIPAPPTGDQPTMTQTETAPSAVTDDVNAVEAILRHQMVMYDWSKAETRAITDYILTARFGIAEELADVKARYVAAAFGWQYEEVDGTWRAGVRGRFICTAENLVAHVESFIAEKP